MFRKIDLRDVTLTDGEFARRRNLVKQYIMEFDLNRLMHTFKKNAGLASDAVPLGGWEAEDCKLRGHFVGHFLSACSKYAYADQDDIMRDKAYCIVDTMELCMKPSGFLAAFSEDMMDTLEEEEDRDIWAPYYTFHKIMQGLLDCYQLLNYDKAKTLAIRLAYYIKDRFDRLSFWKIDGMLRCTRLNPLNEFGGIGVSLYQLYELTKDQNILKLAMLFDRSYFIEPLAAGCDILEDLHTNTHLPMVLAAMYRFELTGDTKYRVAAENFYQYLKGRTFANGNSSANAAHPILGKTSERAEHWGTYGVLKNSLTGEESESCCAHNTEKIVEKLFLWTGKAEYLEHLERLKYNAVLNSASNVTGLSQYHQPMGKKKIKKFSGKYDSFWCCTGTGIEAMSELQKNIWFQKEDTILIHLFISSEMNWTQKGVWIEQHTNYPDELYSRLTIHTKEPLEFELQWRAQSIHSVTINGKRVALKTEQGFSAVRQTFREGDIVEVVINSSVHTEQILGDSSKIAFLYGNILMAYSGEKEAAQKDDEEEIYRLMADGQSIDNPIWKPLYRIEHETYSVYRTRSN